MVLFVALFQTATSFSDSIRFFIQSIIACEKPFANLKINNDNIRTKHSGTGYIHDLHDRHKHRI